VHHIQKLPPAEHEREQDESGDQAFARFDASAPR
jgi:hypothetical protein